MTEPTTQPAPTAPPQQVPPIAAAAIPDPRRKSPLLACILSLMPGLGQVYVGYYQRGFTHILVAATLITLLASGVLGGMIPLIGLFLGFFWLYNMIDAWRRAALYNQVLAGGGEIEMPADLELPGFRGTIAGGATLAILGFVLLLHTRFDFSLDWVEEWWPAAFILFGGYLIFKALQEKAANPEG